MDSTTKQIRLSWLRSGAYVHTSLSVYSDQYMQGRTIEQRKAEQRQKARRHNAAIVRRYY